MKNKQMLEEGKEALQRTLLMMKYDMKKTLTENVEVISEDEARSGVGFGAPQFGGSNLEKLKTQATQALQKNDIATKKFPCVKYKPEDGDTVGHYAPAKMDFVRLFTPTQLLFIGKIIQLKNMLEMEMPQVPKQKKVLGNVKQIIQTLILFGPIIHRHKPLQKHHQSLIKMC